MCCCKVGEFSRTFKTINKAKFLFIRIRRINTLYQLRPTVFRTALPALSPAPRLGLVAARARQGHRRGPARAPSRAFGARRSEPGAKPVQKQNITPSAPLTYTLYLLCTFNVFEHTVMKDETWRRLKPLAVRICAKSVASSACETNWSNVDFILNKRRTKLKNE